MKAGYDAQVKSMRVAEKQRKYCLGPYNKKKKKIKNKKKKKTLYIPKRIFPCYNRCGVATQRLNKVSTR